VEVNGDEVVAEDGASRWPLRRCSVEHAGGRRRRGLLPTGGSHLSVTYRFITPGWTPVGW
jgi:hypothetical protein